MRKPMTALAAVFVFTACDGNPLVTAVTTPVTTPPSVVSLPGTTNPTAGVAIFRYEPLDTANGSGYAESITYDDVNDRFYVDNLAFDGDNFYERDSTVPSLGPFRVYENDSFFNDPLTGTPINQFQHKAIYGVSTTGNTEFAIVRTGQYADYGFGGFLYQRNAGVVLPTTGQAVYSGNYAGIRDFLGRGGLEYVTANATLAIDFEDFNAGDAVRGSITNRQIFDTAGNNITASIINSINATGNHLAIASLPEIHFAVGPNTIDENGEMTNTLTSYLQLATGGALDPYETGTYYAMVTGNNAEEIVGIVVVTSTVGASGITARETGGFIVYR